MTRRGLQFEHVTYMGVRPAAAVGPTRVLVLSAVPRETAQDDSGWALPERFDLRRHADDFDWGRPSAGAAQLALAILACHFACAHEQHSARALFPDDHVLYCNAEGRATLGGERLALRLYQGFKRNVIATLPPHFTLNTGLIASWLAWHARRQMELH